MKRILVLTNDSLLAAAIAARLAEETSPESIHVTHYELEEESHPSLVMVIEDGNQESGSVFFSFYSSPLKTQEGAKRDATHFPWPLTGFDI